MTRLNKLKKREISKIENMRFAKLKDEVKTSKYCPNEYLREPKFTTNLPTQCILDETLKDSLRTFCHHCETNSESVGLGK